MLVIDQSSVQARAALVLEGEVTGVPVPAKQVAGLLIHQKLLQHTPILHHIQVQPSWRFSCPKHTNKTCNSTYNVCVKKVSILLIMHSVRSYSVAIPRNYRTALIVAPPVDFNFISVEI